MAAVHDEASARVLAAVPAALGDLVTHDRDLLRLRAHELALVHRFGVYLERRLQAGIERDELAVDLDYDRHAAEAKYLPQGSGDAGERRFRPDLVVHHRGDDSQNILVVEWKKQAEESTLLNLEARVRSLLHDSDYSYRLGVIVDSHDDGVRWRRYGSDGTVGEWQCVTGTESSEGQQ